MKFLDLLKSGSVLFDGSMGTRLQALGLPPGGCPEELNLERPDLLKRVHGDYAGAGSQVVTTNTFGANRHKLAAYGLEAKTAEISSRAVELARESVGDAVCVGLSVGPIGSFLEPVGPVSFAEALDVFSEPLRAAAAAGADLAVIETMSDVLEVRAAAVAAREAGLPFVITMTFEGDGRTLLGSSPAVAAAVGGALGAAMVGVNCSLGPKELLPIVEVLAAESAVPVLVQPNAGIPKLEGEKTVFPTGPGAFAEEAAAFLKLGVRGLGGCCGTTPEHIVALRKLLESHRPAEAVKRGTVLASRTRALRAGAGHPVRIIGERINPTGKKALSAELKEGKTAKVREEAIGQYEAGADLLDVNVGVPGLDEGEHLPRVVRLVQNIVEAPLVLDSADPAALEAALLVTPGVPLLNSVSAKTESMEKVLPLAVRHGAAVLGLPLDKKGVPHTAEERLKLVKVIFDEARNHGLPPERLVIDGLTLAVGADATQPREILRTLELIREEFGLATVLGVSNISFGLPSRPTMNAAFLAMAAAAGLDMAIINPYDRIMIGSVRSADALLGRDPGARAYVAAFGGEKAQVASGGARERSLAGKIADAVITGDETAVPPLVHEALDAGQDPMEISNGIVITALEVVGERFGRKEFFLPQVIGAAAAARAAFDVLKERFPKSEGPDRGTIVIATVEGDIHDIGKNIVTTLLENHGFGIVDLGTNVPPARIVEAVREHGARLVGLSALMTTTLPAMEATIARLKSEGMDVPVVVGGAVVTKEYAERIGAAGYAADGLEGVRLISGLLEG
jgi:5-methyltetrahydrofolate--homocysteine methyltransferase